MSERFTMVIEGIDDESSVADIEQTTREVFHEMTLTGSWHVQLKPSRVGGRWDVNVRGVGMQHTFSLAVPATLLSSLLPVRLRASLDRAVLIRTRDLPQAV